MPDTAIEVLERLLAECELTDKAQKISETAYRFRWGSAMILVAVAGEAVVVAAPLFESLPEKRQNEFFRKLLELNGNLGGTAAFALTPTGAVVLQVGRAVAGLDADEFGIMLGTVGQFADEYDDKLREEFYQ